MDTWCIGNLINGTIPIERLCKGFQHVHVNISLAVQWKNLCRFSEHQCFGLILKLPENHKLQCTKSEFLYKESHSRQKMSLKLVSSQKLMWPNSLLCILKSWDAPCWRICQDKIKKKVDCLEFHINWHDSTACISSSFFNELPQAEFQLMQYLFCKQNFSQALIVPSTFCHP